MTQTDQLTFVDLLPKYWQERILLIMGYVFFSYIPLPIIIAIISADLLIYNPVIPKSHLIFDKTEDLTLSEFSKEIYSLIQLKTAFNKFNSKKQG